MFAALILSAALMGPLAAQDTPTPSASQSVKVDAYHGDYESAKTDKEMRYDSGILSALSAREGNMEGSWLVSGADGAKLLALELRSDKLLSGRLEGAWRSMLASFGMNGSGFVSSVDLTGRELEVNYFIGTARSPTILRLHRDGDNLWRGDMMDVAGNKTPIVMSRQ